MVTFRKLTQEEATATEFVANVATGAEAAIRELVSALADVTVGEVAVVTISDATRRQMKGRVTKAAKRLGMNARFALPENTKGFADNELVFKMATPRVVKHRTSKTATTPVVTA